MRRVRGQAVGNLGQADAELVGDRRYGGPGRSRGEGWADDPASAAVALDYSLVVSPSHRKTCIQGPASLTHPERPGPVEISTTRCPSRRHHADSGIFLTARETPLTSLILGLIPFRTPNLPIHPLRIAGRGVGPL